MAALTGDTCPACGEPLGANPSWCFACDWRAGGAARARRAVHPEPAAVADAPPAPVCPEPTCAAPLEASVDTCPYCGSTVGGSGGEGDAVALHAVAPWGTIRLEPGEVAFGRHPSFSPYANRLAPHDRVSRSHARFVVTGEGVSVEDCGSANGTFCNGSRLAPGTRVRLRHGDVVSLAGEVEIAIVEAR